MLDISGFATNYEVYLSSLQQLVMKDLFTNLINFSAYAVGMVLYAVVVWYFYRNLAKRDLIEKEFDHPEYMKVGFLRHIWNAVTFFFKFLFVFPVITFVWFLVLGAFLLFLSKSQDISHILLMSMTIIAVARITSYFNEDLSKDVAKLVPFGLLGVFIVDPTFFTLQETIDNFYTIPNFLHVIIQYMLTIVLLEFLLRAMHKIRKLFFRPQDFNS